MKKLVSALTALSIAATAFAGMATTTSAAETLGMKITSGGESAVKVSSADVAAGDVTVASNVYFSKYADLNQLVVILQAEGGLSIANMKKPAPGEFALDGGKTSAATMYTITAAMNVALYVPGKQKNADSLYPGSAISELYDIEKAFLNFDVVIPQGTPDGDYVVSFNRDNVPHPTDPTITNTTEAVFGVTTTETLALDLQNLVITVGDGSTPAGTTTTSSDVKPADTTTTTKTGPAEYDKMTYEVETVEMTMDQVLAGETANIKMRVYKDGGTSASAMTFKVDDKITVAGMTDESAYEGEASWTANRFTRIFLAPDLYDDKEYYPDIEIDRYQNQTVADGSVVCSFNVTVSKDVAVGDLLVFEIREGTVLDPGGTTEMSCLTVSHTVSGAVEYLDVAKVSGGIKIVGAAGDTTSTSTSTSTSTTTTSTSTSTSTTTTTTMTAPPDGEPFYGDTNCDGVVSISDVVLLNRYIAGTADLTAQGIINGDCKKDGDLTLADSTMIKKFLAHVIEYSELGKA